MNKMFPLYLVPLCALSLRAVVDTSKEGSVSTFAVCKNRASAPRITGTEWSTGAGSIALSTVGNYLVTSNGSDASGSTSISLFTYDQITGALTLKETFVYAPGANPTSGITFSPDGRFILVRSQGSIYEIGFDPLTGALGPVTVFNY